MKYFLVLLLAIAPYAYGACVEAGSRCEKASQLVKLMGYEDSVRVFQDSCLEQAKTFRPDVLVLKDPKLFFDITPRSPKWPKVIKAYENYERDYCGEAMTPLLLDAYRQAWAKNLSDQEFDSALLYLQSPGGRGFARALPNIYKTVIHLVSPAFDELGQRAYLRYVKQLRAIADE